MTRALLLGLAVVVLGCEPPPPERPGVLTVAQEQQAAWVRNFNPLVSTGGVRWPTHCGIYEPPLIFNGVTGEWVPWLAESWRWTDAQTLQFTIRDGVKWSDGTPLTAEDVRFTFALLLERKELDAGGLSKFVAGVDVDGRNVNLRLSKPYAPGLAQLAHQVIVPEHIWASIEDPATHTNPEPVGSGPFTEVRAFKAQVFELGRNPHYWQDVAVEALRFPALGSNDQVNLALLNGELDWAGTFVPAIDRVYVGRDPDDHHYWFPLTGAMIFLYANHTHPPFDDVRVRKALSLAIDRERVVEVAMYGYTKPADVTALTEEHRTWRSDSVAASGDWVQFDPVRAGRLLDDAGFTLGPDGVRRGPDGTPLSFELSVIIGWSDWVRACQVMRTQLEAIGIEVRLKSYDFSAWFEKLGRGEFELTMGWSERGPTPYFLYQGLMSSRTFVPRGETALRNWHRARNDAMDPLLERYERTFEPVEQKEIVAQMQRLFVEEAPAIPLFPSPAWGQYNTERFTGFPSAEDPYASLSVNDRPAPLLVMTRLQPVKP